MIDLVGKRYWYFLLSLLIIVPGVIALLLFGLRLSIDFTGGTLWELDFQRAVQPAEVKTVLAKQGFADSSVQTAGDKGVLIRSKEIKAGSEQKKVLEKALSDKFGPMTELRFESVGPVVGQEITQRSQLAVAAASVGILVYISWAFRKVNKPFRYGVCAIVAMLHDVLVVVGLFAIFGKLFDMEIDSLFITALLTVIGFSVHDTIVVFDRIRENLSRRMGGSFEEVVNHSLVQTMARSINTSLTVVLTLSALFLFGGVTIRTFVLALLIGVVSGTYSSIFNASQLLVVWENREIGSLFRRLSGRQTAASRAK
ncbi:MAG: protein translocase subunit SecF [Chloroflexi bacterium]|nr:protein translocase subunit SecF [Chloroflexota bacterium]